MMSPKLSEYSFQMDSELLEFISHLDDDVPFSPYPQLNDMWAHLEVYFDRSYFDIDQFLDELLPDAKPQSSTTIENVIPIKEPEVIRVNKLLQSFTISETFVNDLIPDSVLVVDTTVVTNEILLNSIRSHNFTYTGRQYKHPFDTLARPVAPTQNNLRLDVNVRPVAPPRNNLRLDINVRPVAPPRNNRRLDIGTTSSPSISSNLDWFTVLHKQNIYPGITAEAMAKIILQSESNLPTETEIVNVIGLLFKGLNNYIDNLSAEFDEHTFFDATQFDALARKLQDQILSQFNGKRAPLHDVLSKWMGTVTGTFVNVNNQRRQAEEKVSKKIIDRAVEVYRSRLMSMKPNEDPSTASDKERSIICQGIRHVYLNCGANFTANVLRAFEERLKEVKLIVENSIICDDGNITSGSDDWPVIIELLVSEYTSNINQKGLQCAGISTLDQFNDVNATCLKDILQAFDRKTNKVRFTQQNELQKHLMSKLESESNIKLSEFKRRLPKVSVPSGISSAESLARSHLVGVHFGFESLSVSCYDQIHKTSRSIYGPVANVVSFTQEGISIGHIPDNSCSLNIENLLTNNNADCLHDTKYNGNLAVGSIIALMMMYVDEMVKQNLRTASRIKYAVAIPSCLSEEMQHIFKTAFNIADINCSLVREQCAITASFVREVITKNTEFIVVMIVKGDACDSVVYEITGGGKRGSKILKVLSATGSEAKAKYGFFGKITGLQSELEKMRDKRSRQNTFLLCNSNQNDISKIKDKFSESKVRLIEFDSNKLANGAALLSYFATMDGNSRFDFFPDLRSLSSIKGLTGSVSYRLTHKTAAEPLNIPKSSTQLRSIIDDQLKKLAESKAATKRFIMGKIKDLDVSNFDEDEKEEYRRSLEKDLNTVDEEFSSRLVVENIADYWKGEQF